MSNSASEAPLRRRAPVPFEDCGMALAAQILGDRWSLLILREAFYGVTRYDDIREDLDAPRSMLTDRLGKLIDRGLMVRQPYREPGSRTREAYVLTDAGRALALTLLALMQWGDEFIRDEPPRIEITDKASGEAVRVELVNASGGVVPLSRIAVNFPAKPAKRKTKE